MELKDLLAQLETLKTELLKATDEKTKAALEAEIKKLNDTATKAQADAKAELDATKADLATTKETLAKVVKAQDDMIAEGNKKPLQKSDKSFNTLLGEAITAKAADIQSVIKERKIGLKAEIDLKAAGDMSFSANASTLDTSISTLRPGIITLPKRKLHVRELLPGGSMVNSTYTFLREKTTGEGNPATVLEGGWKEQFDIDLEEIDSPTQYIAGYLICSTKMLDDIPAFISFLQMRLMEKLLRVEDTQLLSGSGVSPNLSGITTSGNFTAALSSATIDIEQVIMAISQLEMADREANGVLISPLDYYRIMTYKASSSGEYTSPLFGLVTRDNGQLYIAGVPVFRSTAIQTDKFIVGDWVNGAAIITREAPRVEIFYEDGFNVRKNQVTVRVEERIAFPIFGSDYFIYGDFGNS